MNKIYLFFPHILFVLISYSSICEGKNNLQYKGDSIIQLKNDAFCLSVDLWGGAIVDVELNDIQLNPLDWKIAASSMPENNKKGAPFQGHFLCLGRWGAPTEGEIESGIPHNGEASNNLWVLTDLSADKELKMSITTPIENWQINRSIKLFQQQACFLVTESFKNLNKFGRFTTIVQHVTMGGEFLDKNVILNSNAGAGFNQALLSNSLTEFEYNWPKGYSDTLKTPIDLRYSDFPEGYVTTHVVDDEIGWTTVANPSKNVLIGYVWKSKDYPWIHFWHGMQEHKLFAKGIEFGTTGLGDTFSPEERITQTFKGRNNVFFVDAKKSVTKNYIGFMFKIDESFVQTTKINISKSTLTIAYETKKGDKEKIFNIEYLP